ncbi:hypothetical protein Q7469_10230 [Glaesserella parasuis]|uniref:Uncharacterized protein n=1 Tax=Glaesserella parasuis TaxID=738 RepID=A0AA42JGE2_GLAPU|nr:hypothetical protein [Glaesserella parasuis]KEZ17246.1 hypothetical protein HS327_01983 [Glaesserella parasuis]MDD2169172.1 hypothetical protein [Glaesserella parasuis]MDG6346642.1 hypothetical protein [Glaesserella parasuis]MDO9874331.1 hypothetical protein [Glaesserella parasuis]MDO9914099.1 hypothetical protein [Glaesserella parasuis]
MAFQKFGKFIFPVVVTVCSLDVLSSAFNESYYDITEQISGNLTEEGFPDNVKNVCTSEINMISAKDMLYSQEYIDYFVDNTLDLRRSNYFPTNECKADDSLKRKEKEAKAYFEKNLESLEKDYREHLENAKKYLLSEDSYEIKNAYVNSIEYDHETYEKTGRINLKFDRLISSFSIEEASGKPFDQLKFYIKPSRKQVDLIEKAQDHMASDKYILRMNIDLDSMKTFIRAGCNYSSYWDSLARIESTSSCIATKLTDAEINILKFDGNSDEYRNTSEEKRRWILIDTIPVRWE